MNIYFYRYGSLCEPDLIEEFTRLGFSVEEETIEMERKDLKPGECVKLVSPKLMEHDYRFVFSINFFPWLSDVCQITGIPYLSLIVDSPVLELYSHSLEHDVNRIFLFDRALYDEFSPRNPGHVFHLPLSACTTRFDRVISQASESEKARYCSEISFIGSTYQEKCPFNQLSLPEHWRGYADGLIEAQLKVYGYNFLESILSDDFVTAVQDNNPQIYHFPEGSIPAYKQMIAQQFLSVKVAEQERIRALKMLSEDLNVTIYTRSDLSELPRLHNRGFARSMTEMPLIFHESSINLNITAKSIRTGLPQRIFDVLGCRGFLITNYQAELTDYFELGKDLVAYGSLEELHDLCRYYLEHEDERMEIANNGYRKVQQLHNTRSRILTMLDLAFPANN